MDEGWMYDGMAIEAANNQKINKNKLIGYRVSDSLKNPLFQICFLIFL